MRFSREIGNDLSLFFIIAFGWSWFFWALQILGINLYVAPFGPFVGAFILTYLKTGVAGTRDLLKKGFDPRIGKVWYLPILLLWPSIAGLSLLGASWSGAHIPELAVLSQPLLAVWNFIYILFLGGPLQEEFGWRGYALPRLQANRSALSSSVILGLLWAVWHLPLNFMYWLGPQYEIGLSMFLSTLTLFVFVSILFTWIYNNTGGSIFASMVFHTMLNLSTYVIFPVFETDGGPTFYFFLIIALAVFVVAFFGPRRLRRKGNSESP